VIVSAMPWGVPIELWTARRLTVQVGEQTLHVVENPGNGMVGIPSLGSLDGMLFAMPSPVQPRLGHGFWMYEVDRPLDIVFFDPAGRAIETQRMEPCAAEPCQVYVPRAAYQWAIESEIDTIRVAPSDLLRFEGGPGH